MHSLLFTPRHPRGYLTAVHEASSWCLRRFESQRISSPAQLLEVLTHRTLRPTLGKLRTCATRMECAVSTLENTPMWSGMAQVAGPLHQRAVGLDQLEAVWTIADHSHSMAG